MQLRPAGSMRLGGEGASIIWLRLAIGMRQRQAGSMQMGEVSYWLRQASGMRLGEANIVWLQQVSGMRQSQLTAAEAGKEHAAGAGK